MSVEFELESGPVVRSLDIIGDLHGQLGALEALGQRLGYRTSDGWTHPRGRALVFLGDLIDRGPHSLEVAELVMGLVARGRALCLMGNHEYNLVAHWLKILPPRFDRPKKDNTATVEDMASRPQRWAPVLAFMRGLPLCLELPGLRLIHAVAHRPSLEKVWPVLGLDRGHAATGETPALALRAHLTVRSPFDSRGLLPSLEALLGHGGDLPHEVLIKGFELPADKPFEDNIGVIRHEHRVCWWTGEGDVLRDRLTVFGHYWNVPPMDGDFAPPHPSGHPDLRAWFERMAPRIPDAGTLTHDGDFACVDFNGVTRQDPHRACAGAYRWPEREIVWACALRQVPGVLSCTSSPT